MQIKDYDTLLAEQAAVIQGSAAKLIDFSVGSLLRAIVQAVTTVVLWLEGVALAILGFSRASTAAGEDLESWMADFGLVERIPALPATGVVTFSRFATGQTAAIPVGAVVQTTDGTQKYAVIADPLNEAFDSDSQSYIVGPTVTSIDIEVSAQTPGSAGNVRSGVVSLLAQAIPFVDTVTNAEAMAGGTEAESDTALRARFILEANNQAKATQNAIAAAVQSVSSAITYKLVENVDSSGAARPGFFYVYVDDGSGATPPTLLTAIANAVEASRGFTVTYSVVAASAITADVVAGLIIDPGHTSSEVIAAARDAVTRYINSLSVGATLFFAQLNVVLSGIDGVIDVDSVTLNGGASNLVPTASQVIRAGTITVSSA